jgi:hypothetical protein
VGPPFAYGIVRLVSLEPTTISGSTASGLPISASLAGSIAFLASIAALVAASENPGITAGAAPVVGAEAPTGEYVVGLK